MMKNPISLISIFLTQHFSVDGNFIHNEDGSEYVTRATGFLYKRNDELYLVTNLHVASGRNIFTQQTLENTGALPTSITFIPSVIDKIGQVSKTTAFELVVPLYDEQKNPLWLVHPKFKRTVDVAAIPIRLINTPLHNGEEFYCINEVSLHNDLIFEVTDDVFVVGYPYGRGSIFTTVLPIPVWKRASIASEISVNYYLDERPVFLIDTTTKVGMSGSPVIGIAKGVIQTTNGSLSIGSGYAMQLMGIYSGRVDGEQKDDSCLGLVWKKELIDEIIDGNIRDEAYE